MLDNLPTPNVPDPVIPPLSDVLADEALRRHMFPVADTAPFMSHAAVTALPAAVVQAMRDYLANAERHPAESLASFARLKVTRNVAARFLQVAADEVSLLGPTTLGLNMIARGIDWQAGDEVVYYPDDYPANVYCWRDLQRLGVRVVAVHAEQLGAITWEAVEATLTPRTKLVALASCHFLSGYQIDISRIGRELRARGVLFSVDAIQTLGQSPFDARDVDFVAADAHKWLLGPMAAGVFYVRQDVRPLLRPIVLGAMNVKSPNLIAQATTEIDLGPRRYEPGALNTPGQLGLEQSMHILMGFGLETVRQRILQLREYVLNQLRPLGFEPLVELTRERSGHDPRSGNITVRHPSADVKRIFEHLERKDMIISLRWDKHGQTLLRFSPHCYNTETEVDAVVAEVQASMHH